MGKNTHLWVLTHSLNYGIFIQGGDYRVSLTILMGSLSIRKGLKILSPFNYSD